jgi:hypothetical protein
MEQDDSFFNIHVIELYWQLGSDILRIQKTKNNWRSKFIEQLSKDLQSSYPGLSGFSKHSLEYMRLLASFLYPSLKKFTQQAAAQFPWSHI